ncbi:protein TIME FOR COFFEE [Cocos nucifera]|uniref:Protein TIME FOR COFFEE n=1 Tax=Cocos nucifera TaxID=13894 RepID=A0A8K0IW24_COCNU|nr:protein TIME FOR COFFEE [Cocos nucifera]
MMHGSNRGEGDDSSEESVEEEEDEEEDDVTAAVRLPPPPPPPNPASSSSSLPQSNHHQQQLMNRKSFPTKLMRTPPVWKADEMIGFSVPRKARSASTKRSHDCWVSGGSGSGEQIPRQASTSPSRLSPASTTQISPSSSNASARKKMKPINGSKHRPAKVSKSPSSIQEDIEIEVAEVLYGMTRQFQCPPKQESQKLDSKDMNGGSGNDAKSRVSSPSAISSPPPASQASVLPPCNYSSNPTSLSVIAPKRKKPRPIKFEDERPTSPVGLVALPSTAVSPSARLESEQPMKTEVSSPRSEKNTASPAAEDGGGSVDVSLAQVAVAALDVQQHSAKMENNSVPDPKLSEGELDGQSRIESQKEAGSPAKETSCADSAVNRSEETAKKADPAGDGAREEKLNIDLMVPPPEREELGDFDTDHKSQVSEIDMASKVNIEKKEEEKAVERTTQADETHVEDQKVENSTKEESNSRKQMGKERTVDLQIDLEKPDKDSFDDGRLPFQKRQPKVPKSEPKPEKPATSTSLPTPMTVAGWPGSFPPFGYMGQVPPLQAIIPMDGKPGSSSILQPPSFLSPQPRPKRCGTHCYIAQNIYYHQRLARMNPFWPAGGGTTPSVQGAKPCNLNAVPPSDGFAGGFPGRNVGSLQDSKGAATVSTLTGPPSKERLPSTNNTTVDAAQRKQLAHQQPPQPGSAASALPVPAFIFPLNQQQAAAAAMAAAATLSGAAKSTPGLSNGPPSSGASSSVAMSSGAGGQAAPVNLSFASLPPSEAQYLAILQNNGYPFPIPAHVAGAPPFRGAGPGQPMPFFYPSQMLNPPQLQQQLPGPQPPPHALQGHQKPSSSSGSSSSQKHLRQSQQALGGGASGGGNSLGYPATNQRQLLFPHQVRQLESDKGLEDSPSTADSRASQAQKNMYGNNFAVPVYSHNFTLMSNATAAAPSGGGGGQSDKQQLHHQQQQPLRNQAVKMELTSSQAFAMPFAFSGAGAAAPGLGFSSMAQNHAFFQSFPEAARHGCHHFATAAAPPQAVQQKKAMEDGKPATGDLMNATVLAEAERKMMAGSKAPANGSQHSRNFSKPDSEPPISSIIGNSVIDISPRTLHLIPSASNASQTTNRSAGSTPLATSTVTAAVNLLNSQPQQLQQQQEQQLIQLQNLHLQHQQHLASTHSKSSTSSNGASVYTERLPGGSTTTKYPQTLSTFPQSLIQGGSPTQSPQWKASTARAATPSPATSSAQSPAKNNHLQQQPGRASQQALLGPGHQTQISFNMNSMKTVSTGGQHHSGASSNPSPSGSAAIGAGSPSNSVSKSAGGSPRASASAKSGHLATAVPLPQQSSVKSCVSSSGCKSSLTQNVPSILGHPPIASTPSSGSKPQQPLQQPLQLPRPYPFPNAQLMFSNACPLLQPQSPQSNAAAAMAAANYYQRRPSEHQQQHQPSSTPGSTGMLALPPSALMLAGASATNDPAKAAAAVAAAAAANSMKGLASPSLMHAAHLAGVPHHLIPGSFPYMMPPVSMKPAAADHKPAAGN